ncbi:MAG TPA: polysaccharide pyruvyl transferase family protein [Opitutaceae bacterium]|nr:polysaccharide pyruvyl transferase family protein [Opitutaceae bacterium]
MFPPFLEFPHSALCKTLSAFKGRQITCLMNKGNCGDGLIHLGGRRLLHTLGLEWEEVVHPAPANGDVLLVYGAGNLGRKAWGMAHMLTQYLGSFRQIVILPATIDVGSRQVTTVLHGLSANAIIFCRDAVSYQATTALLPSIQVHLSHDLAFYADVQKWAGQPHSGVTSIYRGDAEKNPTKKPLVGDVFDASDGTQDEPEKLLNHVARYSVIHTDRTHGSVAGALMGREVHLYSNAYFKNRAIFEHSLCHFPKVKFEEVPTDWPALIKGNAFKAYQTIRSVDRGVRTATGICPPPSATEESPPRTTAHE